MVASARQEADTLGYEWFLEHDGCTCHINERFADSDPAVIHLGSFGANFAHPQSDRWILAQAASARDVGEEVPAEGQRLILVQNFFEELKARVPN